METSKRMSVTCSEDDVISKLPELLIDSILEQLPIQDAVRTSVLSKKWRYKWTTIRALKFDNQFLKKFLDRGAFHHNGVIRVINKIIINLQGPILSFLLRIPDIVLDSFQEIDQWMLIVSRNNVRKLQIANSNRIYGLPSCVFSCLELRAFAISNCIFNPPLEFQGFPNLEELRLKKIHFGGNLGGILINLPQLKYLSLERCDNVKNFNIKAINLKTIWVIDCPDAMLLRLLRSECLDTVCIRLLEPIEDLQGVENFNLVTMLSNLPKLLCFGIDGYFLKFLATQKFPKLLPHAMKCLKKLDFKSFTFGDLDQVQGALCILRNSPNLKVLCVTHVPTGPSDDLELTSNYLESPDCLHKTLFKLQHVELTYLEGSKPELLFIKLLLNYSPHLENMNIRPRSTADAEKMLNIAKDVMMFPRASRTAKMFYLDPVP